MFGNPVEMGPAMETQREAQIGLKGGLKSTKLAQLGSLAPNLPVYLQMGHQADQVAAPINPPTRPAGPKRSDCPRMTLHQAHLQEEYTRKGCPTPPKLLLKVPEGEELL